MLQNSQNISQLERLKEKLSTDQLSINRLPIYPVYLRLIRETFEKRITKFFKRIYTLKQLLFTRLRINFNTQVIPQRVALSFFNNFCHDRRNIQDVRDVRVGKINLQPRFFSYLYSAVIGSRLASLRVFEWNFTHLMKLDFVTPPSILSSLITPLLSLFLSPPFPLPSSSNSQSRIMSDAGGQSGDTSLAYEILFSLSLSLLSFFFHRLSTISSSCARIRSRAYRPPSKIYHRGWKLTINYVYISLPLISA